MYNDNDEMFEVSDFDDDIHRREALIEEARSIPVSSDWNEVMHQVSDLRRRWRRIQFWDSAYEETLAQEFDSIIDKFYAKRRELYQNSQNLKQELIKRAKELSTSEEWNKTTEEMNYLMLQWKAAGTAGKETDDALWEEFRNARQTFFDRRRDHWKNLREKFDSARKIKQDLIQQAAALEDSQEWQKTSERFRSLMDQWKAAGSAGREHEDQLWSQFNASRQKFYEARNRHYDELHEEQAKHYAVKKDLTAQARAIADAKEYTRENTEKMKQLGVDWKQAGSCGREKEDQIWKEFRAAMDDYFNSLKEWNEERHQQWRQRMSEARGRKQELIANQKRQIRRMQDEMVGLLGQRAIDEMQEQIEEKEAFIAQLEAELEDIDKALAEEN